VRSEAGTGRRLVAASNAPHVVSVCGVGGRDGCSLSYQAAGKIMISSRRLANAGWWVGWAGKAQGRWQWVDG
jgi:hypothetical protein